MFIKSCIDTISVFDVSATYITFAKTVDSRKKPKYNKDQNKKIIVYKSKIVILNKFLKILLVQEFINSLYTGNIDN